MDLLEKMRRMGVKRKIEVLKKETWKETRVDKVSGCALCERKESSQWHKNTQTGERDICAACYKKQRAGMAPSNGCALCENKESSQWNKNTQADERML